MNKFRCNSFIIFIFFLVFQLTTLAQNPADECEALFEQGKQAVQNKQYSEALEYFTKGEMLAQQHNLYEKAYYAKNFIGIIYYNLYNYSEALNYYLDAYTFALKHLGYTQEVATLNNIAILYGDENQFEKSEEYLLKAYHIVQKENDSTRMAHYAINLGILCGRSKKFDEAKQRLHEAIRLSKESQEALILKARSALSEVHISLNEFDEAKKILDQIGDDALRLSPNDIYVASLVQLSKYYHYKKEYDKAIEMCQTALAYAQDITTKVQLYEQLSKVNYQKKDFDAAFKYKDSIIAANDSIYSMKSEQMYEGNKVKFELQTYINELNAKQNQLNVERKIFAAAIGVAFILLVLVYRIYRHKATQEIQKKGIALRESGAFIFGKTTQNNRNRIFIRARTAKKRNRTKEQATHLKSTISVK
jgi:tetratricopeptide (TPR) repeat protein